LVHFCVAEILTRACLLWVISDRGDQGPAPVDVRFAPKATVADQNVFRRFVPEADSCSAANGRAPPDYSNHFVGAEQGRFSGSG
jgi:hypothetical protein